MHPRQTISFLLLFVAFRNQTKPNNTPFLPSWGWGGGGGRRRDRQGCPAPQDKKDFLGTWDSRETEFITHKQTNNTKAPDYQRLRNIGPNQGKTMQKFTFGCEHGQQGALFSRFLRGCCSVTTVTRAFLFVFALQWPCVCNTHSTGGSKNHRESQVDVP